MFYYTFLIDTLNSASGINPGGISAEWVFGVCVCILAFFLHRFVTQIDSLTKQIIAMDKSHASLGAEVKSMASQVKSIDHNKIADIALAKLLIMNGGKMGRDWPFGNTKDPNLGHNDE
jgi:hypothetical protein